MVRIVIVVLLAVLGFMGFMGYMAYDSQQRKASQPADTVTPVERQAEAFLQQPPRPRVADVASTVSSAPQFRCDGRTMCSQMASCEEAKFFLKNCPNTRMDGDNDGIPCEQQHC